jgi:putative ABC transport system ATP-binding protein
MILEINNLCRQYKRGEEPFYAVENVNLQMEKGEFACVTGASGSGKSTLFHMIAGLLKPDGGTILIDGTNIGRSSQKELTYMRNRKIGYIMQGQNLLPNFNVLDNVNMPYYLSRKKSDFKESALNLLNYIGLAEAKDAYPSQLSGGELQRVAIARALLASPVLILADEPTGNLDYDNAVKIMELLREISKEGTAVIVSTHDMELIKYSGKTYKMSKGRLHQHT